MNDTDASMESLKSALRSLIIAVGFGLSGYGLVSHDNVMIFASVGPPVAAAAWGVYEAWQKVKQKRADQAKAVAAGINLVVAGQAITDNGKLIQVANPDLTPPKAVTETSAQQIIKNFAPVMAAKP
jgi:hypothetical protein